jgi:5-methyltetrahydrofolate--homocysteine methyltransferase
MEAPVRLSAPVAPRPFIIIGENIHASRVVRRDGRRIGATPDGRPAVRVPDGAGGEALLPVSAAIEETREFEAGRVKHVMAAVLEGMVGGPDAAIAEAYVHWMAARQIAGGAAYLDLNVDEVSPDVDGRCRAMAWLVQAVGPESSVPLSLDSSDSAVLTAGLDAYDPGWAGGAPPLLNSASAERPDVLAMAADRGSPVILSSTGDAMPTGTEERMVRAVAIVEMALAAGLPLPRLYVDPLIIPIGVDAEAGLAYLAAVRQLRGRYGPELHITGGISNVSFGMPARRLISDVFLDLCVQAGLDSGIVDPVAANVTRALAPDRASDPYRLAADLLRGVDAFGAEFIEAFRSGRLSEPSETARTTSSS